MYVCMYVCTPTHQHHAASTATAPKLSILKYIDTEKSSCCNWLQTHADDSFTQTQTP